MNLRLRRLSKQKKKKQKHTPKNPSLSKEIKIILFDKIKYFLLLFLLVCFQKIKVAFKKKKKLIQKCLISSQEVRQRSGWPNSSYSTDFQQCFMISHLQIKALRPASPCILRIMEKGDQEVSQSPLFKYPVWFVASQLPHLIRKTLLEDHHPGNMITSSVILIQNRQIITQFLPSTISPVLHSHIFALLINSHTQLHSIHVM